MIRTKQESFNPEFEYVAFQVVVYYFDVELDCHVIKVSQAT